MRIADAWAVRHSPGGAFRRKLVLLLAILESNGRFAYRVDSPEGGGAVAFALRSALRAARFAGASVAAAVVLGPRRRRWRP